MKDDKRLQVHHILLSSAREIRFLKDILQQAPNTAKNHSMTFDAMFSGIDKNLRQASDIVMKGVKI